MDQRYNIGNLIMDLDESIEDRIAIQTLEKALTYGQLHHLTTCFALHLRARGVDRSSCVAISTTDVRVAVASTLAIALLGGSWVQANRWSLTYEALGITHLLHGRAEEPPTGLNAIEIDESWTKFPDGIDSTQPVEFDGYASPEDTWMIQQSSGSTGHVKFMAKPYRCASIDINRSRSYDIGERPWIVTSLIHPLEQTILHLYMKVLLNSGTVYSGNEFEDWIAAGVNTAWATPAMFRSFLPAHPPREASRIATARACGARTSSQMMNYLFRYFETVQVAYASSETLRVAGRLLKKPAEHDGRVGRVDPHADLQIVDANDHAVAPNEEGLIRVRSDIMVHEYISDPEATAAAFRDGWFYPGDLGHLTEDGQLVITGRATDILNLGGIKVNAVSIDEIIQAQAGVADGICFAKPDELGVDELAAIVTLSDGADANAVCDGIRAACRKELGAPYVPKHIFLSDGVPRNERGKATRHLAIEAVEGIEPASVLPPQ